MLSVHISVHRRYQRSIFKTTLAILLVVITLAYFDLPAQAIGPGTGGSKIRVNEEQIGPYILLVATSPLPVTADQSMSVWVRVADPARAELRREATVMVAATSRNDGTSLTAQATHQNAGNDYDYVAHFPTIQTTGQWDIIVTVDDVPGSAEVSFVETVSKGVNATIIIGLAIPFTVIAVTIGWYLWRRAEG